MEVLSLILMLIQISGKELYMQHYLASSLVCCGPFGCTVGA